MTLTGDCLEILPTLDAESVDSIVTDPPYGLKFMGKSWDHGVPGVSFWEAALRVAKPGAFLLAFGGTRTHHRLMVAIEDAGWDIRDCVMWVYGSGFPKSLDVSKAIDKVAGVERAVVGVSSITGARKSHTMDDGCKGARRTYQNDEPVVNALTAPATDAARQWEGWGTALKPAWEPIVIARKPLVGTVAENVLQFGTGGLNIDGCRVDCSDKLVRPPIQRTKNEAIFPLGKGVQIEPQGRWPANLIHDGSEEVLGLFPNVKSGARQQDTQTESPTGWKWSVGGYKSGCESSSGSAARFFYCAKASKHDRDEGCDSIPEKDIVTFATANGTSGKPSSISEGRKTKYRNNHPTVKPLALMRYLCRLVTPPGGTCLDMFCGSGSTGKAAEIEGFKFIGIDKDKEATEISEKRIEAVRLPLFQEATR